MPNNSFASTNEYVGIKYCEYEKLGTGIPQDELCVT